MNEILPCPMDPNLLCIRGVCGNHELVVAIEEKLDDVTAPLIEKARERGLTTEREVQQYVERNPRYRSEAAAAKKDLQQLDPAECAPMAYLPSAS